MDDDNMDLEDLGGDDLPGSGSGGDDAPPADGDAAGSKDSKRVNDLMSKWQTEQSRANAAEARIRELEGKKTRGDSKDKGRDPEVQQWIEAQVEFARDRAFNSDPRLARFGLTAEAVAGATPAEMAASVKRYSTLIESIETKVRNEVLADNGLVPDGDGAGGTSRQSTDFGAMSDEDFEKAVRRGRGW